MKGWEKFLGLFCISWPKVERLKLHLSIEMEMLCAVSRAPRAPVSQQAKASFQPSHPAIFDVMTKIRVRIAALQIFS